MKKQINPPPQIPLEIITYLETIFPDRLPQLGSPLESIREAMGSVAVIRHLRKLHEQQTKTVLKGD